MLKQQQSIMLIVQITQSFFSHGGVMKRARQETLALLKAGHRVIVITDLRWTSHAYQFKDFRDKFYIIPIKPIYFYGFRNISSQLSFAFKTYYTLKKLSKKESIDLIVSHQSTACYAVVPFIKKRNIPAAWVIQDLIRDRIATGNPYNWWETQLFKHSNSFALKRMSYAIPVSIYTKRLAILDGARPATTFVKYNSVNTEKFNLGKNVNKDIDILFIGRLSIEKGLDILIESTNYISTRRKILIIGDGPLYEYLKIQAKKIKRHDMRLEGFVNHNILPQFIQRTKLLVAPSRSECHASVPIESMACGVPVIASRVAGMEDTIQNEKNGWLLGENNAKTLGLLIEKALSNEKKLKLMSQAARKRAEFFSEKKFSHEIVDFYEKLVKKFKSP